jgi:SAM-dependent methyltransferase
VSKVFDASFWKQRLEGARELRSSVYVCSRELWEAVERKHREVLAREVGLQDSVLDAGCGYGRLIDLLPDSWSGRYLGVDLSPDFTALARGRYPVREFRCADLRRVQLDREFDVGVAVSLRAMVLREAGRREWAKVDAVLRAACRRVLYLEYDPDSEGELWKRT